MFLQVFYDGKCGLCRREIDYYRRIAPKNIFKWSDIASDPSLLSHYDVSQADALRLLHVLDHNGKWFVGVDAFLVIWKQLKYWRFLAVIVSFPGIKQTASTLYKTFAKYRFSRLKHCQIALKRDRDSAV